MADDHPAAPVGGQGITGGRDDKEGMQRLKDLLASVNLSPDDALSKSVECLAVVDSWELPEESIVS